MGCFQIDVIIAYIIRDLGKMSGDYSIKGRLFGMFRNFGLLSLIIMKNG